MDEPPMDVKLGRSELHSAVSGYSPLPYEVPYRSNWSCHLGRLLHESVVCPSYNQSESSTVFRIPIFHRNNHRSKMVWFKIIVK